MPDDTIGDLARQDLYPDERYMQPPQNAVGGLTPEDWMMAGQQPPAATYDYVPPQSWLQKAGDLARRDVANYQTGGVPAMMGQLAADSSGEQDLAGGFGGNIKGVGGKIGALADLAPHAPPFYSAVEQAVQGAKQTTAPGQQWAGFLRNQPGVKPEELNTLKLGDLFDQTGAVTKQDLLDHIAANKVQLGEVVKGSALPEGYQLYQPVEGQWQLIAPSGMAKNISAEEAAKYSAGQSGPTKFSQYTLPGGENYRETLLTLPTQKSSTLPDFTKYYRERFPNSGATDEMIKEYWEKGHTIPAAGSSKSMADPAVFKSSHFDEPNVLAHIRTNDRVIDGKKTLFVEEVQSDWHQKGKREGYQLPSEQTAPMDAEYRALVHKNADARARGYEPNDADVDRARELETALLRSDSSKIPDAPFKTTWPDLAMKRVIRQAAEGGYDKVAWTPGSVQADRYDLSKQVNQLDLTHNRDGAGELVMTLKDGRRQSVPITSKENLADTVGKDMAEKLYQQGLENNGKASLAGVDLKIGGEGMKGFYDQILPAAVNKIVKKAGGRVGQAELGPKGQSQITGEVMPQEGDAWKIQWSDGSYSGGYGSREGAERVLETRLQQKEKARAGQNPTVHTLDITPQLREMALKKGFPLFTAGGLVAGGAMGDLAKQDEYQ